MGQLRDAVDRYNTIKHEHVRDEQRDISDRTAGTNDCATLNACLHGTGIDGREAMDEGARVVDAVFRDCRRAGKLRAAKRGELRALIFAVWIDGVGVGLHARRNG